MFLLTNDQRTCLGLPLIKAGWEWVRLKDSPYEEKGVENWACFDDTVIRRMVRCGPDCYQEGQYVEETTQERMLILPRTARGKPKKLSAVTLSERRAFGMGFSWQGKWGSVWLGNDDLQRVLYSNRFETEKIKSFSEFCVWLDRWMADTTSGDLADIAAFSRQTRQRVKFREGDFFRFPVGRRQYGYGRVLLDYYRMTKRQPAWSVVMVRPVVVKVYHLITEDPKVPVEELRNLPALPAQYTTDNDLYYGQFPIVGNLRLQREELDYPVMYGGSIDSRDKGKGKVYLQCGPLFRQLEGAQVLCGCEGFRNNGVGGLRIDRELWEACIIAGNNSPFWEWQTARDRDVESAIREGKPRVRLRDLRNPAYWDKLEAVCRQFGIMAEELSIGESSAGHHTPKREVTF